MKKIPLLIAVVYCIFIISPGLNAQWIIEPSYLRNNLNSIALAGEKTGWIVGDNGTMLEKNSSGWSAAEKVTDANLYSVALINENSGWAVGSSGTILRFDAGEWQLYPSPTNETLFSVSFFTGESGIAVGSNGIILLYQNDKWTISHKHSSGETYYSVLALDRSSIISGGIEYGNIPVMEFSNKGNRLSKLFDPGYIIIKDIAQQSDDNIWAVGMRGAIFKFNADSFLQYDTGESMPSLNGISFYKNNTGVIVGYGGTILTLSEDQWIRESVPVREKLNGCAISDSYLYAVGNKGRILKKQWNSPADPELMNGNTNTITLESYPNPATDYLNIIIPFTEESAPGYLSLSSASGTVMYERKLEPSFAGQTQMVDISELPNGLYLINYFSREIKATGKFVIRH
jgi:photosystem II stability/assembly factor-like uncharacterized protein